jgi:hypothetical protein
MTNRISAWLGFISVILLCLATAGLVGGAGKDVGGAAVGIAVAIGLQWFAQRQPKPKI